MMKKILLLCLLLGFKTTIQAQNINLIPNPSFENNIKNNNVDTSIKGYYMWDTVTNNQNKCWIKANYLWGIMDNYNKDKLLDLNSYAARPKTGSGFLEILTYLGWKKISTNQSFEDTSSGSSFAGSRPYAQVKLLQPLQSGKKYYFSMYIGDFKGKDYYENNVANVGAYFSNQKVADYAHRYRLNVISQINFTNYTFPKFDTFQYVHLQSSFVAQGGEEYLTIGNFDKLEDINYTYITPRDVQRDTVSYFQWYNIDDVSLVADSTQPIINLDSFSLGNDTVICPEQNLVLGGSPYFYNYLWSTGDTTKTITINQAGTYWCTVDAGCSALSDTIVVSSLSLPGSFLLQKDTVFCAGSSIALNAPPNYIYTWSTGEQSQSIVANANQTYWCSISNACGTLTDSVLLKTKNCSLYFPTAFSPNGDNLNEEFKPLGNTDNVIEYSVYNRWGNKVYESTNAQIGWKGVYNGIECTLGTYFYFCKYKENNEVKILKGSVELVR